MTESPPAKGAYDSRSTVRAADDLFEFQRLVADIAVRFGGVEAAALDQAITDTLRQIGEMLHLDRAVLWRHRYSGTTATPTHTWVRESHAPVEPRALSTTPFVVATLNTGTACAFSRPEDLPDSIDRDSFSREGVRSCAIVPLLFDSQDADDRGALAFTSLTRSIEWTTEILERLRPGAGV